jgi:hypothetical protein
MASPVEMEVRDEMQKIALESPAYGYRRITHDLQQRGFDVNHKRVLRMMREDNLLCVRRRAFVVTTDSRHNLSVYPNLAREMQPTATNQLWVADITYIRLRTEFVVPGGDLGRLLAACGRLGLGPHAGSRTGYRGITHGVDRAAAVARTGPSLRSRRAVCSPELHRDSEATSRCHQHEPQGKSL